MNQPTNKIIELLKQINSADNDNELKEVLVAKFKHQFPENVDWLDMLSIEKIDQFEQC